MQPRASVAVLACIASVITACSSETETAVKQSDGSVQAGAGGSATGGSAGNGGAGAGAGGSGNSSGRAGAGGAAGSTASGGAAGTPTACAEAGGTCECSCGTGTAEVLSLMTGCPQPCALCGGCSMQCCVPTADGGTFPCGSQVCAANQICVQPCVGIGPQPPPRCATVPSSCGSNVTCGCLPSDICSNGGMCTDSRIQGHMLTCFGCA